MSEMCQYAKWRPPAAADFCNKICQEETSLPAINILITRDRSEYLSESFMRARCKTVGPVDPVGPHLVPQFIVRAHQIMGEGIRSLYHFHLSPESDSKAELASNKMLKLVNDKFLITDDTFYQITNRD
jgi:hypothetical protein